MRVEGLVVTSKYSKTKAHCSHLVNTSHHSAPRHPAEFYNQFVTMATLRTIILISYYHPK